MLELYRKGGQGDKEAKGHLALTETHTSIIPIIRQLVHMTCNDDDLQARYAASRCRDRIITCLKYGLKYELDAAGLITRDGRAISIHLV
jgi:hypothetical protein